MSEADLKGPYVVKDKRGRKTVRRVNFMIPNEDWDMFESLVIPGETLAVSLRRVFRVGLEVLDEELQAEDEAARRAHEDSQKPPAGGRETP